MPIVKTQGGKVVTKDGKVSCECCGINCAHTANFADPLLWDPLTDGGFSQAVQIELTAAQYAMFTAGGALSFAATGSASVSGSQMIGLPSIFDPTPLTLFGTFSFSINRTVEATFLNNSCKQKGLIFTNTQFSASCSSSGSSTGTNAEFYPYMELNYPCSPFINVMSARLSFYNASGTTGGKLYSLGMYVQFSAQFSIFRDLQYGIEGFSPIFDLPLTAQYSVSHTTGATAEFVNLVTPEGTIPIPCTPLSGGSAEMTFTPSAP